MYNIYCDESCHLENDGQKAMVLGAIRVPKSRVREISSDIREIKLMHGLSEFAEIKWTKVSPAKLYFYQDIVDYFFNKDTLKFRALIVPDKTKLNHQQYNQTHDDWYYKMYFNLLKKIVVPKEQNYIYLDIKDTQSGYKVRKLHEILCNNAYDFDYKNVKRIQNIRSDESQILQITDLLIGAISYTNRGLSGSKAKMKLVQLVKDRSGYTLTKSTFLSEDKFNIFVWDAGEI